MKNELGWGDECRRMRIREMRAELGGSKTEERMRPGPVLLYQHHQPPMHVWFPGSPGCCEDKCHSMETVYNSTKMPHGLEWMWMDFSLMVFNTEGEREAHKSFSTIFYLSLLQSSKHSVPIFLLYQPDKNIFCLSFWRSKILFFSFLLWMWLADICLFCNGQKELLFCWF